MTASALAKRIRCTTASVTENLKPSEWHHTSGWYNRTDYYDEPLLVALADGDGRAAVRALRETTDFLEPMEMRVEKRRLLAEARDTLDRMRASKQKPKPERRWEGCTVEWLVWSGTKKHPVAHEHRAEGCTVVWKGGAFVTVTGGTLPKWCGGSLKKKIGANEFSVCDAEGRPLVFA